MYIIYIKCLNNLFLKLFFINCGGRKESLVPMHELYYPHPTNQAFWLLGSLCNVAMYLFVVCVPSTFNVRF